MEILSCHKFNGARKFIENTKLLVSTGGAVYPQILQVAVLLWACLRFSIFERLDEEKKKTSFK